MNEISVRQAMKYMTNLHVKDGDVIAIKVGTPLATTEAVDVIAKALEKNGFTKCIVAVVNDFDDLKVLDEAGMLRRGWVNMDKVRALGKKRVSKKAVLQ